MSVDRPYATFIGVDVLPAEGDSSPLCTLKPGERIAGASNRMHGGALAGLLEAAAGALVETVLADTGVEVNPVSITIDYLRAAPAIVTHANAEIVRRGERIVHVDATAWQECYDRPIATARLVFSLRR